VADSRCDPSNPGDKIFCKMKLFSSKRKRLLAFILYLAYSLILVTSPVLLHSVSIRIASISTDSLAVLKVIALVLSIYTLIMAWLIQARKMEFIFRQRYFLFRISSEAKSLLYSYIYLICPMIFGLFLFFCGMPITQFYYFAGVSIVGGVVLGTYNLSKA
jgi:hypothetical protein